MSRTGVGDTDMDEMPSVVTDSLTIRGLRWEYFSALSTLGPCLNLNRVVFGPPANYDEWLQEVHDALVRTDDENELFELARRGGVESCTALAAAAS